MSGNSAPRTASRPGLVETFREQIFVLGALLGVALFSFGVAFLIIASSMGTTPPAPYFANTSARVTVIAVSVGGIVGGGLLTRWAARIGGW